MAFELAKNFTRTTKVAVPNVLCGDFYIQQQCCWLKVAWNIFTNGKQTLGLNLSERFTITDNALIDMKVPCSNSGGEV